MTTGAGDEAWSPGHVHAAAAHARALARAADPEITPTVQNAVEAQEGRMAKLDTRIKPQQSLVDKITGDREPADADPETALERINDVLRYTAVLPPDPDYWDRGSMVCEALVAAGYHHIRPRRGLRRTGFKGRNERFEAPGGQRFELQIHTQDILEACDETRPAYEEMKHPNTSMRRQFELQQEIDAVFASVPIPDGTPLI
jgi:hypothetical protein